MIMFLLIHKCSLTIVSLYFTRVRIACPPSGELFKVNFEEYLSTDKAPIEEAEEEDEKSDVIIASH